MKLWKTKERALVDLMSVLVLAGIVEFKYLHWITPINEITEALAGSALWLTILPMMAIFARIVDYFNWRVCSAPITAYVSKNHIELIDHARVSVSMTGSFSSDTALIADSLAFGKVFAKALSTLLKSGSKIKLSPYVILAPQETLTHVEQEAAIKCLKQHGALHAEMADETFDNNQSVEFAQNYPPPSIF